MIRIEVGSASLVGQVRTDNEDSYLAVEGLAAVADGMGGHRGGEVASADTIEALRSIEGSRSLDDLVRAVHLANRRISERAERDPELAGMGTTVVVVGLVRRDGLDEVAVLNVGDSRVYLQAAGGMHQLTEDHSLVESLVRDGRISTEEAANHPQKNVLTRALGVEPLVVVDAWLLRPCDGDRLLLCSDGLTNELDDDRIAAILSEGDPPDVAARRLAAEADAAGGRDNVTTVVLDVVDSGREPAPLGDRFRRITTPAVDLSDEPSGPHTETVMAVIADPPDNVEGGAPEVPPAPSTSEVPPLAGDADIAELAGAPSPGSGDPGEAEQLAIAQSEAEAAVARANRWRTAAFIFAIFGVVALAVGAIAFTARRGWYVAANDAGVVALYRGTPVLWMEPTEVEASELAVSDMNPADRRRVEGGSSFSTESEARKMIENLSTTTTSTTTTSTSTTMTSTTTTSTAVPMPATDPTAVLPSTALPTISTTSLAGP
jgi:protein phosphatase